MSVLAQENLVIDKIKFKGNSHFSNSKLKDEITIESDSWIKEKILKEMFLLEKKIQNGRLKKAHFPAPPILIFFEIFFPGIGP